MAANKKGKQGSQQEDSWLQKFEGTEVNRKSEKRQNRRAKEKEKTKGRNQKKRKQERCFRASKVTEF